MVKELMKLTEEELRKLLEETIREEIKKYKNKK